jgi:hypothetical protein
VENLEKAEKLSNSYNFMENKRKRNHHAKSSKKTFQNEKKYEKGARFSHSCPGFSLSPVR